MCESSAYLLAAGKEELLLEGVELLRDLGKELELTSLFGVRKRVKGRVKALSLVEHKIILEPPLRMTGKTDDKKRRKSNRLNLEPEGGETMMDKVKDRIAWLGHDAFRVEGEKTLYFDPYLIQGGPKADIIFITHDHFDHCSPEDVAKVQGEGTVIVADKDSARKLKGEVRTIRPGQRMSVGGIEIEAVPAYNTNKDFHPRKNGWLGFVVEVEGIRFYHAGDTDFIPEMKGLRVDVALLPVSGTYVMTAEEAVQAALAMEPKLVIPMHYGAIVGSEEDAVLFKKALEGRMDVLILPKKK